MTDTSTVTRVKHGRRESTTELLTADNLAVMRNDETGEVVLELFRYDSKGEPVESYQMRLCREDRGRVKVQL